MCPDVVDHRLQVYGIGVDSPGDGYPDFTLPEVEIGGFLFGVVARPPIGDIFGDCPAQLRGTTIIRGSHFDGHDVAVILGGQKDSHNYVGGRYPWQGNVIKNVTVGVVHENSSGGRTVIGQNHIDEAHSWGVLAFGDPGESPTTMKIIRNHIRAVDGADGIGAIDLGPFDGEPMLNTKIGWNKIEIDDTPFNGIVAVGTDGRILNNKITGKAVSGITLEPLGFFDEEAGEFVPVYPTTGWRVAKNWFPHFEYAEADIFLRPMTAENTVECAWWGHEVVDLGVDNELIGCGESGTPAATTQAAGGDRAGLAKALASRGNYGR